MRHRGKYKNWLKLGLGIVGVVGAGWLLTTVPLHNSSQAKGSSIFDKGGGRYFGNGSSGPNHNVLPPMYRFSQADPNHEVPYAIDPPRVGIPESELTAQQRYDLYNDPNADLYQEVFKGQGAGFIITAIESREEELTKTKKNDGPNINTAYARYKTMYKNNGPNDVGEINQCIQKYEQHYANNTPVTPHLVNFNDYKHRYPRCVSWLETGYKFLRYSLVGVPQSQSNNKSVYDAKKEDFIADTTKVVTVQKMTAGGRVAQYYEGTNSSTSKFTPDGMNTAINENRNDVIGYRGTIRPSLAVVVWEKPNGLNQKYRAQWILRLRCANPIGASLYTKTAKVDAQVKGEPNPVFLPLNGTAKVTFKYKIYKSLRGFSGKDTSIKYSFSGHNRAYDKLDFNPNDVKVTKVEPNGLTLGSTLKPEKAVVLGKGIPYAQIEYQEEVTIDHGPNSKNKVWYAVDATSGHICRTVQAKPDKSNNMPDPPKSKLTAESTSCVDIKFGEAPGADGTIYVFPLAPDIASITDPILPDYKGINSYAIRKKQWSYWHKPGVSESGYCGSSKSYVQNSLSRQCNDICKNDPENKINCNKKEEKIRKFCCRERCKKGDCWCVEYQHEGTAKCYHYQREENAKWQITKMIFKPETNTAVENTPLSSPVSQNPCDYFKPKLPTGSICQSALDGNYSFDSTSGDFSIKNGFNALNGLIHTNITPIKGGLSDNVKPHLGGLGDLAYEVEALPSGTKVCFAASIYPWRNAGNDSSLESYKENKPQWRHSQPRCFVVSKKPFFTVENGMLLSGGNIVTNLNRRQSPQRRAGSWAEYNAISQGDIGKLFATNSGSFGSSTYNSKAWHRLSFANQGKLGQFEADATSELIDPASFFSHLKTGRYANTTITSHTGGNISGSLSGVHVYNGNATITGDISDNSSANHGSLANTSQAVIVVNGDLTINNKVRNIDAWLIVTGTLMTSQNPVTANTVEKGIDKDEVPLTITGPVKAGQVKLRRTYGSGIHSPFNSIKDGVEQLTKPAETFRHTPKTYIWSYYNSLDKGQVQTVYLREVAPRY